MRSQSNRLKEGNKVQTNQKNPKKSVSNKRIRLKKKQIITKLENS